MLATDITLPMVSKNKKKRVYQVLYNEEKFLYIDENIENHWKSNSKPVLCKIKSENP